MNPSAAYILLSLFLLAVVAWVLVWAGKRGEQKALSPLAGLAFALILAGMVFGDGRWPGYALQGAGILLAGADIFEKTRKGR